MWQKAFYVALLTFLVVFTAVALVFFASFMIFVILPRGESHGGVFAYSGGLSLPFLKFIGLLIVFTSVVIISLVARRRRFR
jgi:hypothetical protein